MAPAGAPGVDVVPWTAQAPAVEPGDVVVEAFGCDPPPAFVERMRARQPAPVWINLEYLSAEDYVERSHRLPSPRPDGLAKWFFYPGFTPRTGGLLRESDLAARQHAFDASSWLAARGASAADGEQVVSLFCYEASALPALVDLLATRPTLLLVAAGAATRQIAGLLGPGLRRGALRAQLLPALTQRDYDHLLWASDLNFVRGEDSFVRAQWAAKPFVWQIYPQHDAVHIDKLDAFLRRFLGGAGAGLGAELRRFWHAWNGDGTELPALPDGLRWAGHCRRWRDSLQAQADLTTQLLGFVAETG
jgi:uncharacterized repeat protein (TIGR03837 family)